MASGTGAWSYAAVIEDRTTPAVGGVAVVAAVATGDVVRCLALCGRPVVTAGTGTQYIGMVHAHHRGPAAVPMTVLTKVRRLDVRGILAVRRTAIVATETAAGNTGMIEVGRCPGVRRVAVVTGIATGDVV